MGLRRATFAGSWYPADAGECERKIRRYLKEIDTEGLRGVSAVGGIVPHAGWFFSGSIACNVIQALSGDDVDLVIIFGMHLPEGAPRHIMAEGEWETPLGPLRIDSELAAALMAEYDFAVETPERYQPDNGIELQLPFVKYLLPNAKILPVGVPPAVDSIGVGARIATLSEKLGRKARIIGSTDLTHYGANYGFSPRGAGDAAVDWVRSENDARIVKTMLKMDPSALLLEAAKRQNACCAGAAAAAIAAAGILGARRATAIAYATSCDKSPGESFVGYSGVVLHG